MTPLPRATCPACQRNVAIRNGGELREHRNDTGTTCWASGYTVGAAQRIAINGSKS